MSGLLYGVFFDSKKKREKKKEVSSGWYFFVSFVKYKFTDSIWVGKEIFLYVHGFMW